MDTRHPIQRFFLSQPGTPLPALLTRYIQYGGLCRLATSEAVVAVQLCVIEHPVPHLGHHGVVVLDCHSLT